MADTMFRECTANTQNTKHLSHSIVNNLIGSYLLKMLQELSERYCRAVGHIRYRYMLIGPKRHFNRP